MVRTAGLLCLLLVLAGCSAIGGPAEETATMTPAPVPTPETATPAESPLPPGVTGNGVADIDQLKEAHQRALANQSYTWRTRNRIEGSGTNGTERPDIRQRALVADETTYEYWTNQRIVLRNGRPRYLGNYSEFGSTTARFARFEGSSAEIQYRRLEPAPARLRIGQQATAAIDRFLPARNTTISVTRFEGARYYELRGRGAETIVATQPISNYTVRALIRPDGFVRSLTVSYRIGSRGRARSVTYTFDYSALGTTTVGRPAWATEQNRTILSNDTQHSDPTTAGRVRSPTATP